MLLTHKFPCLELTMKELIEFKKQSYVEEIYEAYYPEKVIRVTKLSTVLLTLLKLK